MNLLSIERTALPRPRRAVFVLLAVGALIVGCGGATDNTRTISDQLKADLLSRWSAVADGVTVQSFGNFHWGNFDQFPHPTFKGGSAEAYQAFAGLLVAFYEHGDNFDFLTNNRLFRISLHYVTASGQPGSEWTFEGLTSQFANNDWASIPAETVQKLQAFEARIRMAP